MDQKQIFKQMIDFNKATFENAYNTVVLLQDQAERMTSTVMDQTTWMPEEGKKAVNEWVKAYKKGRDDIKKSMDHGFEQVENFVQTS